MVDMYIKYMHGNIFDQIKKEIQLKQQFFNSEDFLFKN